jgi:serpin B
MPEGQRTAVLGHVVELIAQGRWDEVTDGQLLERYARSRDEAAFTALVRRHGGMVLGVARRVLDDLHAAEDVFQATFFILARKGASLDRRRSLAGWLHTVARRVALNARTSAARRRRQELAAAGLVRPGSRNGADDPERPCLLDAALQALPEKYRVPLVLCYLEGKTNEAAALELGWPIGSMSKRLARARELLHDRLTAQGVTASAGLLAACAVEASAPVPLIQATVQAATLFAAGSFIESSLVSPQVVAMAQGVLRAMFLKKCLMLGALVLVVVLAGGGLALAGRSAPLAQTEDKPMVVKPIAKPADPAQIKADRAAVAKGNRQFAFDLYQKLRTGEGNLFLSPYSISAALAMTEAGARGDTRAEMLSALHFTLPGERLYPAFGVLQKEINGGDAKRPYELRTANALWGHKDTQFEPDYLKLLDRHFGSKMNEVDFVTDREKARAAINAWVAKQTRERIKELLKSADLQVNTRLVLTNAIVFKADWEHKFNKADTRKASFQGAGHKASAFFMNDQGLYRHMADDSFQALELPFAGKDLALVVFLPNQEDGLLEFEKSLSADRLSGWLAKLEAKQVDVKLPRFRATGAFHLKPPLSALGIVRAFDRQRADFTGIADSKLFIDNVVHQAFIEVNENGAEAAAATAVVVGDTGGPPRPKANFHADHTFFFVVRDKRSDSILFMGRLMEP